MNYKRDCEWTSESKAEPLCVKEKGAEESLCKECVYKVKPVLKLKIGGV